jgi:type II secretory pathway component PulC
MRRLSTFGGRYPTWAVGLLLLASPQQLSAQSMPDSSLPLTLLGVMVAKVAPFKSACLIRCRGPEEKVRYYELGQTACDLAEVKEVREDAVIINDLLTNRSELLTFEKTKSAASAQSPVASQPSTPPRPPSRLPAPKKSPNVVTIDLPKALVDHYLENLPDVLDSVFAAPRYQETANGRRSIDGFEISRIRKSSVIEQLGLENGDVLLELNGQRLDSLPSALVLFSQAQSMSQSRMTVLRNGQTMTFVFNRK